MIEQTLELTLNVLKMYRSYIQNVVGWKIHEKNTNDSVLFLRLV